jgi:hypothetical protein
VSNHQPSLVRFTPVSVYASDMGSHSAIARRISTPYFASVKRENVVNVHLPLVSVASVKPQF